MPLDLPPIATNSRVFLQPPWQRSMSSTTDGAVTQPRTIVATSLPPAAEGSGCMTADEPRVGPTSSGGVLRLWESAVSVVADAASATRTIAVAIGRRSGFTRGVPRLGSLGHGVRPRAAQLITTACRCMVMHTQDVRHQGSGVRILLRCLEWEEDIEAMLAMAIDGLPGLGCALRSGISQNVIY